MREIRTLRATWRGLETWCGSGPPGHNDAPALDPTDVEGTGNVAWLRGLPARQSSTLLIGGIEETSASFEARSAPRSYPTDCDIEPGKLRFTPFRYLQTAA